MICKLLMNITTVCFFALALGTEIVHAAGILKELECHDKVVQQGVETLSFAKEANALFGNTNVDHFISSFGSKIDVPVWNSVTYFGGRYTLNIQVPIAIDYQKCGLIRSTGPAAISVNEVTSVELSASGRAQVSLKGGIGPNRGDLSESEWRRLIDSRGDWSIVNVPISTNRTPIKNFDEYVRQARAPIRNRKEGFDNLIRRTSRSQDTQKAKMVGQTDGRRPEVSNGNVGCYENIVQGGLKTLKAPAEVISLFAASNVDHFISKFGNKTQMPVWHSITYFAERYRLLVQFPIAIDYEKCSMVGAINSAFIQIDEITAVDASSPGTAGVRTKGQWRLNENEWRWLLKNQGDWSVVKVPIRTNAPVIGFAEYVKQERKRPVESRQEDFDKPVRNAIDASMRAAE